jgi:hypothetical protein
MKERLKESLLRFFPGMVEVEEENDGVLARDNDQEFELLTEKKNILPYVQTLFFEERMIEIQIDDGTRLFFAGLWDHPPELEEVEEDGEIKLVAPEYESGSYLKNMDHLVLSPLEPVTGNIKVRASIIVTLRFYTGSTAVEMGSNFLRAETIRDNAVLIFEFPEVGRIIKNHRPFRAKVPEDYDVVATVHKVDSGGEKLLCKVMDISAHGVALENEALAQEYHIGDQVRLEICSADGDVVAVGGIVRHFARIRTKAGNQTLCGVQFDLETRALAAVLEQLFAQVQRIFMRSLNDKLEGQDIQLTL